MLREENFSDKGKTERKTKQKQGKEKGKRGKKEKISKKYRK